MEHAMWTALETLALLRNLPTHLKPGDRVNDIHITGQIVQASHFLHFKGVRNFTPYLLKQFYSFDMNAFLQWQNEARFTHLPHTKGFLWPEEEWPGGIIQPYPNGETLETWLQKDHDLDTRLRVASMLAHKIAFLHESGIAHRGLSTGNIHVKRDEVTLSEFGHARFAYWDDFWSDSIMPYTDALHVAPEVLQGVKCCEQIDVFSFGAILHQLLTGTPPFGSLKRMARVLAPSLVSPNGIADIQGMPGEVRDLITSSLSLNTGDRPTMGEAASILSEFHSSTEPRLQPMDVPFATESSGHRDRLMVFVKGDHKTESIFDTAISKSGKYPSTFLIVGLLPNNLPSGHMERFRADFFRRLGDGLARCRAAGLQWGLRLFENIDPKQTAIHLVHQYRPDDILIGQTNTRRHTIVSGDGSESHLTGLGSNITWVS